MNVSEAYYYDDCIRYKVRHAVQGHAPKEVGDPKQLTLDAYGYLIIRHEGKNYKAHRVIWLLTTGEWPVGQLDHKNLIKTDNVPDNLRDATATTNAQNREPMSGFTSKYKGVAWDKDRGKWVAKIYIKGKPISKYWTTERYAAEWYDWQAKRLFGECAYLNFPEETK